MQSAIFLDRDGVINLERKDYVKNLSEFEIFPDVAEAIDLLRKKNFLVIIIIYIKKYFLSSTQF